MVKNAKKEFFLEQLRECKGDQGRFWTNMYNLFGRSTPAAVEWVYKLNTDELLSLEESVDEMNRFFAEVGDRATESVICGEFIQLDPVGDRTIDQFSPCTEVELLEILSDINENKSSGIEGLPTSVLFDFIRARPDIFVKFSNKCLESGVFPSHCKVARIKVIPKKGDVRLLDNVFR